MRNQYEASIISDQRNTERVGKDLNPVPFGGNWGPGRESYAFVLENKREGDQH